MKWPTIIASALLLCLASVGAAQVTLQDSLLQLEMRYYHEKDSAKKQVYLVQKCNLQIRQQQVSKQCLQALERLDEKKLSQQQQAAVLWNKALCNYVLANNQAALYNLAQYKLQSADTSLQTKFVEVLALKFSDTLGFRIGLQQLVQQDTAFKKLKAFTRLLHYEKKHQNRYLLASALLPGAGSIALGYPVKGLTSTAVNASAIYAIVALSKHNLYANAILWGSTFGLKFYVGNIALTEKLFTKREQHTLLKLETTCKQAVSELLEKYPLQLRAI